MKKTALVVLSLVLLLSLASCYWRPDTGTGGLRVDLSGIAARVGNPSEVVRIYLIADELLFSAGGATPFVAEVPASGLWDQEQKVSITGLPVGPKYRVMVGLGLPDGSGGYYPSYYGDSGQFMLTPGGDTAVSVTLQSIDYPSSAPAFATGTEMEGRSFTGVVESDYGDMYAAEAGRLYFFNYSLGSWNISDFADIGYRVNSLSRGAMMPPSWVSTHLNTDNGLHQFYNSEGFSIDPSFSATLGGSRDIRGSSSFSVPSTEIDYAVFFRRSGGLGGAYVPSGVSSEPSLWSWLNVDMDGVSDLAVSQYNAYYAADGGVFALAPAYLQDPGLAGSRVDLPAPAPVLAVGFRPSGVAAGGTLYLGTANGVWKMDVEESTAAPICKVVSGPTQVAGTGGDRIERVAINRNTTNHEAYLSRYYLYIVKSGFLYDRIPFFAVLPGRATGMDWDSSYNLYISGSEGMAAIYAGS